MQRIVITGGAGFIGSNLVRHLQKNFPQAQLLVIDDFRCGIFANLLDDDQPCRGDVIAKPLGEIDWHILRERFAPDVIFHEASITDTTLGDDAKMIRENVEPFRHLLDLVAQTGTRLVWASSAATYGHLRPGEIQPFALEDAGRPANAYGFSKWVMENLHRQFLADHPEAHIVGLRYFNVFGPREHGKAKLPTNMASMVHQLTVQMLNGKRPRVFYDGEQARDQVPVADVVDATIAAAAEDAVSGIYNVGSGAPTTFNQIIDALNEALGMNEAPEYFENPYSFTQDFTCADLTETISGIHWQPSHDVRESIMFLGRWLKQRHTESKA